MKLSTKDMTVGSGKARPLMGPGNTIVRINSITIDKTPWDANAFQVNLLHVLCEYLQSKSHDLQELLLF